MCIRELLKYAVGSNEGVAKILRTIIDFNIVVKVLI
jgi:hypothetical protein